MSILTLSRDSLLFDTSSSSPEFEKEESLVIDELLIDTLIMSDIHLGSEVSRSKDALEMLKQFEFSRLILNGDVFEDLNFKRLSKDDWKFLSHIRKLFGFKRDVEVVWVAGNHDGIAEILSHLLGLTVYDEYIWEFEGEKYLAIHGHQFDRFLHENIIISNIATWIYKFFQRIDSDNQSISRWMKRRSKTWLRVSEKIANDAIAYAKSKRAQYIFCGHTHQAMERIKDGVTYVNSGCWTDIPSQCITIERENGVNLREYR
ncbi:MAG: UDP-2,3-diacylglucosamine diphosphatase [Bacteroidota bacterium]|nr:UDP-2,3-diacylglucosamine diphosphatase [Bacteroidota bacterium]MDP4231007.1 UDP-2,3-diacylglucosamine diphosphatase [Bacteroidota bacterium]MDP4236631.1 UDP-2,3-diacylglucosamine diphosphatase [Bacteroidota bacterium]